MIDLFSKLPQIWQRLDLSVTDVIEDKGFLQRYLMAPTAKFQSFEDLIREYLRSQNVEQLRDTFIPLLNDITGHRWKDSRSRIWNRNRIQVAITRASYKGTDQAIKDLAREYGATYCEIIDNASLVDVWNVQYGMFFDADFFHPGVYQLLVSDDIDLEHFLEDFEYLKAGGTKWYIKFLPSDTLAVTEYNAGGEPRLLTQNLFTEDRMWWWNYVPQPPEYPLVITKDTHVVMNASLFMGSLTLQFDEELVIWGDGILPAALNHKQPLIDIDVPT